MFINGCRSHGFVEVPGVNILPVSFPYLKFDADFFLVFFNCLFYLLFPQKFFLAYPFSHIFPLFPTSFSVFSLIFSFWHARFFSLFFKDWFFGFFVSLTRFCELGRIYTPGSWEEWVSVHGWIVTEKKEGIKEILLIRSPEGADQNTGTLSTCNQFPQRVWKRKSINSTCDALSVSCWG